MAPAESRDMQWASGWVCGDEAMERSGVEVGSWDRAAVVLPSTDIKGVKGQRTQEAHKDFLRRPREGELLRKSETKQQQNHLELTSVPLPAGL